MTVLYGDLKDVSRAPFDQQGTAVVISATQARPELTGSGLILTELCRIEMEDSGGHFETDDLDPGPVIVMLQGGVSHGQQWEIGIPMEGRWNLADLIGEQVEWEPDVTSRAEAAARESSQHADRAEGEADRAETAADRVGSAERVLEAESTAVDAEADALEHRDEASRQADRARAEADRATGQASAASGSADTAVLAQGDASASADHAADRADWSERSADVSRKYNDTAWKARSDALDARTEAVAAKDDAVIAKESAQASATAAQGAATTADQTVRDAVTEVTAVTDGHRQAAETAAGEARASATEGRGYRDDAREAAAQAEDIATGDLPSASESTRGLIQMTGDLAGSGDEPRVPALALAAPGASVQVVPLAPGWANAVADAAATPTGWGFDGEWLTPPPWLDRVTVTVDWCGGSSVVLRGRRPDGTAVTLATVPAGTPETHRSATVVVDLSQHEAVAVAATWTQEDLEAVCTASLVVQVLPSHEHTRADLPWWDEVMSGYVRGDDARLSDPRSPTGHEHEIGEVRGLDAALGVKLDASKIQVVAALPESPVEGTIYLVTGE
ncbi:MAG: hypothetical protein L0K30_00330 [Acidipropionibacterium jensenii]|uniref:hypothetical protein n=1 Tax=Acidipropionibacterium jensenii TaxID=1749 RepID=UPI00264727B5|nr:hypothetical protein [Acidipropionibacterium jensenii]MDN6440478.1 hypothetical protein [Acidipropionibacterium jensenii]